MMAYSKPVVAKDLSLITASIDRLIFQNYDDNCIE